MAQITQRFEVAASEFPLFSDLIGRTIVAEEERQTTLQTSATQLPSPFKKPQMMYAENVLPVTNGYRSVGFQLTGAGLPGGRTLYNCWKSQDSLLRTVYVGAATDGTLWLFGEEDPSWSALNTPVAWNGEDLTFATVSGSGYIFVPGAGLYEINGGTGLLVQQTVAGITESTALGICGSFGYLIFYDTTSIYYSSATDPLDHVPSISTGAGSGAIQEARGAIRYLVQTSLGFNIYCEQNAVSAQYSQNIRFPWVFKSIDNSLGCGNIDRISTDDESGNQYVLTSGGMMALNVKAAKQVFSAVTDFLAAERIETYNRATHASTFTLVPGGVITRLKMIGARWLVLSYGVSSFTQALVYDTVLKRWGKLVVDHVVFVEMFTDYRAAQCDELPLPASSYLFACDNAWIGGPSRDTNSSMLAYFNAAGELNIANLQYLAEADALVIFGRFELTRKKKCQLHEIEVETVGTADVAGALISSALGKTQTTVTTLYKLVATDGLVHFLTADAPEAENHLFEMRGTFHVVSQQITATQGGKA